MKRFLLLALTAGLLSPIAANAESVWLVLYAEQIDSESMEKIQMKDMAQCLEQGKIYRTKTRRTDDKTGEGFRDIARSFICLKGK